eukprot:TRINITY_DN4403_c0_g3_i1.p1 TRINITY_DN4403_c0_g3~~TRINITY_DN4403_c0_g3_i1.p1  ORF type:complete len:321 (-),score=58.93 TRINITY_DN4403_c0_g3_i1:76-1038(-)
MPLPNRQHFLLRGHKEGVLSVRFNDSGSYFMSCSHDRTIRLWNPHKGTSIKTYVGHSYEVRDVQITKDNGRFASCGGDRTVYLWDVGTGQVIRKFRGHDTKVNCVRFNSDDSVLITAGSDRSARVWDMRARSFEPIQIMRHATDSITSVCVTAHEIVTGSMDGCVRTYDIRQGKLKTDHISKPVTCVSISKDTNCLLVSTLDDCIRLLDRETGELLNTYKGHRNHVYTLGSCFSNDDAFVISGSEDHSIHCWELVDAKPEQTMEGHSKAVACVAYHPTECMLLSGSADGSVAVWTGGGVDDDDDGDGDDDGGDGSRTPPG